METQRQRERLKLIEEERKKKDLANRQQNSDKMVPVNGASSTEHNSNGNKSKRVTITTNLPDINNNNNNQNQNNVTPTKTDANGGSNSNSSSIANQATDSKKQRRKPRYKKPYLTDETNNQQQQQQQQQNNQASRKTPQQQQQQIDEPLLSSRAIPNSKSPVVNQPVPIGNKENNKPTPKTTTTNKLNNNDAAINRMKRQISNASHVTDKYEFLKTLGDGNFAVVKQARLKSTDHEYAIKIIDKSKMKGKESMIDNEILIMKACNHPNIVKLYEEYETKDEVYLVTDLVKGGDLFDAITQTIKFNERDASCMVHDLCEALFYLHSKNIVHRDLKPENLLVMRRKDDRISIKLADFGLAMEVKSPIYTVCGTPTYVAPEILSEIGYGLEVDMWACGVITYILLCGFPPVKNYFHLSFDSIYFLIKKFYINF